jgi:dipeptidyl aminopeptidase/acylaminoacyl peptidase
MLARTRLALAAFVLALVAGALASAPAPATTWEKPPQPILDVLNAPDLPTARLSPTGEVLALLTPVRYPPLEDLARPALRLAGVRIDPRTNGRHGEFYYSGLTLQWVEDGRERRVSLPDEARVSGFQWSADGTRFAFLNQTAGAVELWFGKIDEGVTRRARDLRVNPTLYSEFTWMPDQKRLLVKRVPPRRGSPPEAPLTPPGPRVQESTGQSASSTYEARDVLTGPHDEALFEHYALSQLALVDAANGRVTPIGEPGIFAGVRPSPDGQHILVQRLHEPWSYSTAWNRFPRDVEVWNLKGEVESVVARIPLADQVPIQGVPEGPREHAWRPTEPATLVWYEALDGGDPGRTATHRDRVMMQSAPFDAPAREVYRAPHRVQVLFWGERDGLALVQEYERERRWRHVSALDVDADPPTARPLFDLSMNERYADPGYPMPRVLPNGFWVMAQEGESIFLEGDGSTPDGDRPFLDRLSLTTAKSERLFRCDPVGYEYIVDWLDITSGKFLTRRESPTEAPNYVVRTLGAERPGAAEGEARWDSEPRMATHFDDPTPQIRSITKRIVTFERADGTPLSFTLYLPPGYVEGTRLPTVLDAYPLEFSDPGTAGQVSGTSQQFTRLLGATSLFFLLDGYAVLSDVSMPVIGDPDTAYDTFIEQLVASAEAAIAKAAELGVTDPDRVGAIGHSHGGLMVATLLAHSDLFRAGIARSGAYNHTMRPFGFQSERRTLWKARDVYVRLSPVMHADKINEPLLLIHGQADQNPGTVPLQSEKLFEAVRGTGGTARLLMLPFEQHGYQSREAVQHVLAEEIAWFGRHVKGAAPRTASREGASD